jgi:hypothetical protein
MHYNAPDRFQAPWQDVGKHQTRFSGLRRLWVHPPHGIITWWRCCIAGEGSTSGDTRESAIDNAKRW